MKQTNVHYKKNAAQQKQWLQLNGETGVRGAEFNFLLYVLQRCQGLQFYPAYFTDPAGSTARIPVTQSQANAETCFCCMETPSTVLTYPRITPSQGFEAFTRGALFLPLAPHLAPATRSHSSESPGERFAISTPHTHSCFS